MTPKTFTAAKKENWIVKNVNQLQTKVRVDMQPRFYKGGKAIVSFWLTYTGAKRLNIL